MNENDALAVSSLNVDVEATHSTSLKVIMIHDHDTVTRRSQTLSRSSNAGDLNFPTSSSGLSTLWWSFLQVTR
jgi:hypothetical protein